MSKSEEDISLSEAGSDEKTTDNDYPCDVAGIDQNLSETIFDADRSDQTDSDKSSTAVQKLLVQAADETQVEETCSGMKDEVKATAKIALLFSRAIFGQKAKSEAEAVEEIGKERSRIEGKIRADAHTINKIRAEATEAIGTAKAEAVEKVKIYTDMIARIRAEALEKARAHVFTADKGDPSSTVDKLLSKVLAKQKTVSETEVAREIALIKARAEEKFRAHVKTADGGKPSATVEKLLSEVFTKQKTISETEVALEIALIRDRAEEKFRAQMKTADGGKPSATVEKLLAEVFTKQKTISETEVALEIALIKDRAEEKLRAHVNTADKGKPSATVEKLLSEVLTKQKAISETEFAREIALVKAKAEEMIAKQKVKLEAEAEERTRAYINTIVDIKAQAEEKAKAFMKTVSEVKPSATVDAMFSKAVTKQKATLDQKIQEQGIAQNYLNWITTEAQEVIARVKREAEDAVMKVRNETDAAIAKANIEDRTRALTNETLDEIFSKTVMAQQKTTPETKMQDEAIAQNYLSWITTEAKEVIARVKSEARDAVTKIRTEADAALTKAPIEYRTRVCTDATIDAQLEEQVRTGKERSELPIPQIMQKMTQSPANLPDDQSCVLSALGTESVMQQDLVWVSPDDTVQQAFARIQQKGASYVMVGWNGRLEGIVSKSDLAGAISPYLQPKFSKWRMPKDDATLQIKIKWIMSKPVHITSPQKSLKAIMANMCRFRVRALPVVDQQGKVLGLVTVANIFRALLKLRERPDAVASNKAHRVQSVPQQALEHIRTQAMKASQSSLIPA